eukprot:1798461-Pleurochrysis_carterae.AAC.2
MRADYGADECAGAAPLPSRLAAPLYFMMCTGAKGISPQTECGVGTLVDSRVAPLGELWPEQLREKLLTLRCNESSMLRVEYDADGLPRSLVYVA